MNNHAKDGSSRGGPGGSPMHLHRQRPASRPSGRTRAGKAQTPRRGLSMVEVLISLTISAMLLTAVTAAFSASASAVQTNDEFFRASQAARVSLNQILTEIRRCQTVAVSTNRIDMITHDNRDVSFIYDDTGANGPAKRVLLSLNDNVPASLYSLASNVTSASFNADTATDESGRSYAVRVSVTLVVERGKNTIRLAGSAAPRKVQTYR